jgi:hypothetical protein
MFMEVMLEPVWKKERLGKLGYAEIVFRVP